MKKKKFTHMIALLLIPTLLLTICCGCSLQKGNRPFEQSLKRYITALSIGNYDLLKYITTPDSMIRTKIYDTDEKVQENFQLLFNQIKLQTITNAEQYDNEITVTMNITHTDYEAMIENRRNLLAEKIKNALPKKDFKQETLNHDLLQLLLQHYDERQWPDKPSENIALHLQKVDGVWLISNDDALYHALSDNFNESFNSIIGRMTTKILDQLKTKVDPDKIETGGAHIFENPDAIYFTINNSTYFLPCQFHELQEFQFKESDFKSKIAPYRSERLYIRDSGQNAGHLEIYNDFSFPLSPIDCMVSGVRIDYEIDSVRIGLPGNITFGSSMADIIERYGSPSKVDTLMSSDYVSFIYYSDEAFVKLNFADGVTLSGFEINI